MKGILKALVGVVLLGTSLLVGITSCEKDAAVPELQQVSTEDDASINLDQIIDLIEDYEALVPSWIASGDIKADQGEEILNQFERGKDDLMSFDPGANERSFLGDIINFLIGILEFLNDLGLVSDQALANFIADVNEFRCSIEVFDYDNDGVNCREDCNDNDASVYPGAICDDGDANTINDTYNVDCECLGSPATCTIGESCDDGDPLTENDVYNNNCVCEGELFDAGTFTDPRNGQTYATIEIGSQTWMAENLNYTTGNSWCYNNNSANCNTYGRLYDWQTALSACPAGWHLPTDAEWTQLTDYLGGTSVAGGKMKEAGLTHWRSPNMGATNSSGFTGLPGGFRFFNGVMGYFSDLGGHGYWWSATEAEDDATHAWYRHLDYYYANVAGNYPSDKENGLSCRCVRD
ncbi:MAG: hypothetical protein GY751_07605 [Bacteroidetes bacterium]|nr:hypothetical protein [Bacteroidota bacterium]